MVAKNANRCARRQALHLRRECFATWMQLHLGAEQRLRVAASGIPQRRYGGIAVGRCFTAWLRSLALSVIAECVEAQDGLRGLRARCIAKAEASRALCTVRIALMLWRYLALR